MIQWEVQRLAIPIVGVKCAQLVFIGTQKFSIQIFAYPVQLSIMRERTACTLAIHPARAELPGDQFLQRLDAMLDMPGFREEQANPISAHHVQTVVSAVMTLDA